VNELLHALIGRYKLSSVTADSREVKPGAAFVAIQGTTQDGRQFIGKAQEAGAALILGEGPASVPLSIPYVEVEDARLALSYLATEIYGNPSHSMLVVGVTGTSGKTTTTYLIEAILQADGHRVGVVGTVNFRFGEKIYPSTHTTPGPVELQRLLGEMKADGCTAVVMEVSSHALKQKRTAQIAFNAMVFSNLTPEHLDFHPDMEDYFRSKAMLFTDYVSYALTARKRPIAVLNADDEYGARIAEELRKRGAPPFLTYGLGGATSDIRGDRLTIDLGGIRGSVGTAQLTTGLTGRFNAYNLLAAFTVARGLGLDDDTICKGLSALGTVPGRLERVSNPHGIHVLVDYAHKPDALEKVLLTLKEVRGAYRLITVFGCGGDRDRKKRPVMGKSAVEHSDHVFVTSDNPRTEDPRSIIQEILVGTQGFSNFTVEPDRRAAIFSAINMARPGDVVVIAGKGHEDYQIVGTQKVHFDDREVAAEALRGCHSDKSTKILT
jgi:UDP-N-acetylmuramoyl-L-alanyl-D-glutamate--2,6-diaminopimelate ligase